MNTGDRRPPRGDLPHRSPSGTQLTLVVTTALVLGRLGWSLARLIDRRASRPHQLSDQAADRLRAL